VNEALPAPLAPDDAEMESSRAPLLDHLIELRRRLLTATAAVLIAFLGCFAFAQQIFLFLVDPFLVALRTVHGGKAAESVELYNTHAFGFFIVEMKVALFAAIVIAFPVIAYQLYAFVAPGLYKRERKVALPFLIAAPVMFLAGAAFVYFIAMPFALEFALRQEVTAGPVHVRYLPKVDEYLALVTTLVLAFGAVFQTPVVLALLARAGAIGAGVLRKNRRYAVVAIAAFSALVTPPDVVSMTIMALPVYALYEVSILIVAIIERGVAKRAAAEAAAG
jgi:sec-independent protein translocase protein TatC